MLGDPLAQPRVQDIAGVFTGHDFRPVGLLARIVGGKFLFGLIAVGLEVGDLPGLCGCLLVGSPERSGRLVVCLVGGSGFGQRLAVRQGLIDELVEPSACRVVIVDAPGQAAAFRVGKQRGTGLARGAGLACEGAQGILDVVKVDGS